MNTKDVKDIRKQLKNVAQALAPTVLSSEAGVQMYKQLMQAVEGKLKSIELDVQETLKRIDERSKDLQSYAMRQISAMMPVQPKFEGSVNEEQKPQSTDSSDLGSPLPVQSSGHGSVPEGNQE